MPRAIAGSSRESRINYSQLSVPALDGGKWGSVVTGDASGVGMKRLRGPALSRLRRCCGIAGIKLFMLAQNTAKTRCLRQIKVSRARLISQLSPWLTAVPAFVPVYGVYCIFRRNRNIFRRATFWAMDKVNVWSHVITKFPVRFFKNRRDLCRHFRNTSTIIIL